MLVTVSYFGFERIARSVSYERKTGNWRSPWSKNNETLSVGSLTIR